MLISMYYIFITTLIQLTKKMLSLDIDIIM
jgi:lipopolysaccharide biosynthesis glycosyltransferase